MILGRDGKPDERFDACPPPCRTEEGCPKGTPENSNSLLPIMQDCYDHYRECRAVGQFPDDAVVRLCASAIRNVEEQAEAVQESEFRTLLISAVRCHR